MGNTRSTTDRDRGLALPPPASSDAPTLRSAAERLGQFYLDAQRRRLLPFAEWADPYATGPGFAARAVLFRSVYGKGTGSGDFDAGLTAYRRDFDAFRAHLVTFALNGLDNIGLRLSQLNEKISRPEVYRQLADQARKARAVYLAEGLDRLTEDEADLLQKSMAGNVDPHDPRQSHIMEYIDRGRRTRMLTVLRSYGSNELRILFCHREGWDLLTKFEQSGKDGANYAIKLIQECIDSLRELGEGIKENPRRIWRLAPVAVTAVERFGLRDVPGFLSYIQSVAAIASVSPAERAIDRAFMTLMAVGLAIALVEVPGLIFFVESDPVLTSAGATQLAAADAAVNGMHAALGYMRAIDASVALDAQAFGSTSPTGTDASTSTVPRILTDERPDWLGPTLDVVGSFVSALVVLQGGGRALRVAHETRGTELTTPSHLRRNIGQATEPEANWDVGASSSALPLEPTAKETERVSKIQGALDKQREYWNAKRDSNAIPLGEPELPPDIPATPRSAMHETCLEGPLTRDQMQQASLDELRSRGIEPTAQSYDRGLESEATKWPEGEVIESQERLPSHSPETVTTRDVTTTKSRFATKERQRHRELAERGIEPTAVPPASIPSRRDVSEFKPKKNRVGGNVPDSASPSGLLYDLEGIRDEYIRDATPSARQRARVQSILKPDDLDPMLLSAGKVEKIEAGHLFGVREARELLSAELSDEEIVRLLDQDFNIIPQSKRFNASLKDRPIATYTGTTSGHLIDPVAKAQLISMTEEARAIILQQAKEIVASKKAAFERWATRGLPPPSWKLTLSERQILTSALEITRTLDHASDSEHKSR